MFGPPSEGALRVKPAAFALASAPAFAFAVLAASPAGAAPAARDPIVRATVRRVVGLPVLEERSAGSPWRTVCIPPCELRLAVSDEYRIAGDGVVDSGPFELPAAAEHVRVEACLGSTQLRGLGTGLAVGGFVFAAAGGAILLLPASSRAPASDAKTVVGAGFIGMGLLTVAAGVVAWILSETRVTVSAEAR